MFELNQLEQLLAIEKYKTISGAAKHLNISQPALSRSIQRLEEEFAVLDELRKSYYFLLFVSQNASASSIQPSATVPVPIPYP